jgi:hypothetical protein
MVKENNLQERPLSLFAKSVLLLTGLMPVLLSALFVPLTWTKVGWSVLFAALCFGTFVCFERSGFRYVLPIPADPPLWFRLLRVLLVFLAAFAIIEFFFVPPSVYQSVMQAGWPVLGVSLLLLAVTGYALLRRT